MRKKPFYSYLKLLEKEALMSRSYKALQNEIRNSGILNRTVSSISADSRTCQRNGIFFCKGRHFLKEYLFEALEKEVFAVVYEASEGLKCSIDSVFDVNLKKDFSFISDSGFSAKNIFIEEKSCIFIEVKCIRRAMAVLAAFHYDYPMKKAVTVAVTGTKGKTSTVTGISGALNENKKNRAMILNDALPEGSPHLTTPEPIELHAAAARCIENNATHIICEISSQGVKALRTYGIVFDVACFLNFGMDHISPVEHPDTEDYFRSKASLFTSCKNAVINLDSEKAEEVFRVATESSLISVDPVSGKKAIFTFSFANKSACFSAEITEESENGSFIEITESLDTVSAFSQTNKSTFYTFEKNQENISVKRQTYPICVNKAGFFNSQNALAVYSCCRLLGCSPDEIFRGTLLSKAMGRMEVFDSADGKIRVIVDYAHNEMSFEALFKAAKQTYVSSPPGITAIFGCSGEKAYGRRYDLPKVALKYSDRIIICEDDSGREPFEKIKNDILSNIRKILSKDEEGYKKEAKISVIQSRENAIGEAIGSAYENGERRLILFTGKGRERTAARENGEVSVTDDVTLTLEALKSYNDRLSLDTLFSGLTRKDFETVVVSFEKSAKIIESFSDTVFYLLRAGITVIAVCDEGYADLLRECCYKNGIACHFSDLHMSVGIRAEAISSVKRGALTVVPVKGSAKADSVKISIREKADSLVYLTQGGGIILSGRTLSSVFSEKTAAVIAEKTHAPYLRDALIAVRGGVKQVAVIDGREKNALAFYSSGSGFTGTVIKKDF